MTKRNKNDPAAAARRRAEIIMKVRSGFITASQGAALLGVSRKTYYKWENRALKAMMTELEQKRSGRPETPAHERQEAELQHQIEELKKQQALLEKQLELKDLVHRIKLDEALQQQKSSTKNNAKKKR